MKLEITKACADSLRAFTQNNYCIPLKSSHAHELVAAYFGYASRASLIADRQCPIDKLMDAEIIILNPSPPLVNQRLKSLGNLSVELPPSDVLAEGVYAPIVADEQFSGKIWPGLHEAAMALVEERAKEFKMFGKNIGEMNWISNVNIKTTESHALMTVIFDYPANTTNALRYSKVDIMLPRIAGGIGYSKLEARPTFYYGHMTDPDFRLKHGID
ncbi:hypothetical protein [Mucilaginibacter psychrotolerans]|uniref:Uncharacterized protein n=1 Tax=Mucilaginibacter psychrotolerans TaxID=1524096 RepID=A0A4Y8S3W1_9SPHI|nr:hypothetical protein [Mucilaginibacter psychrotolerans]TFF33436.1 hypothetical protein E2R66_25845 [Mucilaginibacter psychrotolerans]